MDGPAVRERASEAPDEPGVYRFLDGERTLYVGKAVSLRDRVRSYADPRSARIARMVERADAVDVAVTDTETQALLLEANLIKRFQPRYNVRLTDDKSYPMVQLTDHDIPRIELTRTPDETARVFGPFTDVGRVETVVTALRDVYGLRGCSEHKYRNRDRPCLDHDVGLCTAPCTGEIADDEYREDVAAARRFLEGETEVLADPLREAMERAAADQRFERAATLRDRLAAVEALHDGAKGGEGVEDVLGAAVEGESATVARLRSEGGGLVDRDRRRVAVPTGADARSVLGAFVTQFYAERELPDSLLVPDPLEAGVEAWLADEGVDVRVPAAGREAELVDLALRNAHRTATAGDDLDALGAALGIGRPERIEGVDVSHASGRATVGSNVVFVGGTPETDDYRRKKLPDSDDDYASMHMLVAWRARRGTEGRDERPDPDLLVVDGGRGQLEAATAAAEDHGWDVSLLALAKDEERVYTPDRRYDWDDDTPQLQVLQRVRDEAHRFAVRYHRTVRDDVATPLDEVEGVGPALRRRLLRRFGTVEAVREATADELRDIEGVGPATAERLQEL